MFNKSNTEFLHKNCADVRINLIGAPACDAVVYLSIGQRLTDLLNDERAFIPVRRENGETIIIAKSQIASILEKDAVEAKPGPSATETNAQRRSFDPYATLRVSPDASSEEIRTAYKARIKAVHPDTVAALDLDADLANAALLSAQKVNYAYQKILRDREAPIA